MTTPENPYDPAQNPPPPPGGGYGQPPAYGAPQYSQQPAPYGQAPYGQAPYGQPGVAYQGTLVLWPTRAGGFLIDVFLAAIPAWILEGIALAIKSGALLTLASLVGLGIWIWNLLREARTGQTVGKTVMGTYLVKEADGQFLSGPHVHRPWPTARSRHAGLLHRLPMADLGREAPDVLRQDRRDRGGQALERCPPGHGEGGGTEG